MVRWGAVVVLMPQPRSRLAARDHRSSRGRDGVLRRWARLSRRRSGGSPTLRQRPVPVRHACLAPGSRSAAIQTRPFAAPTTRHGDGPVEVHANPSSSTITRFAQCSDVLGLVGGDQHGGCLPGLTEDVPQPGSLRRVQAGGRLVEDQEVRVAQRSACASSTRRRCPPLKACRSPVAVRPVQLASGVHHRRATLRSRSQPSAIERFRRSRTTGRPVHVAVVDDTGTEVPLEDLAMLAVTSRDEAQAG